MDRRAPNLECEDAGKQYETFIVNNFQLGFSLYLPQCLLLMALFGG